MLNVIIEPAELGRAADALMATQKQVDAALRSTLGKMAKWVKTRSVRGMSDALGMQQKVIRRRVKALKAKKTSDGQQVSIWYGENPVGLIYLGARQNGSGVSASGGRTVKSAFIAKGKGGGKQVFKRTGSSRLPVKRQAAEVKPDADKFIESNFIDSAAFEAQFYKVFEHELQWQTRR